MKTVSITILMLVLSGLAVAKEKAAPVLARQKNRPTNQLLALGEHVAATRGVLR